jgi:hypothetical protein
MPTVLVILFVTAFVTSILSAMGKCPAWVPCLVLSVAGLLQVLPKG